MKRLSQPAALWRVALIALIFAGAGIVSAPPVFGSGPTLAVTQFSNAAGAPQSTVDAISSALYQSVDQSGKFSAVGGGPLRVKPALDGSITGPAIAAASQAGASEVVVADLLNASGSSVVYRLTAYRTAPLNYIRTQVFSQSSLSNASLAAGFVTNLETLHAPREALGTIYSLNNGIHADLGSVNGFQLGQQFNVMRGGQKVAQAQIAGITSYDATVQISNAVGGYQPQVGDALVGLQPLPPLNPPVKSDSSSKWTLWGVLVATGAALLAIGQHGQAASVSAAPSPSPTASGIGGFSITSASQTGAFPTETFTFIFSQPVNASFVNFANTTYAFYTTTNPVTPQTPITQLGSPTFDSTDTVLTLPVTCSCLNQGQVVTFSFTSSIISQLGVALTPYTSPAFTYSFKRHKAASTHGAPPKGGVLKPPPADKPAAPNGGPKGTGPNHPN